LELASNGEIFEYLAKTEKFPENIARYYFKQLISALLYINQKGFVHRDLKPENLFLDENFNLKLADFGFAACVEGRDGSGKLKSILGTESYMAPELNIKAKGYHGIPIDLFSAGVILFIFMTGTPCFKTAHPNDQHYKLICTNNHTLFWKSHMARKNMKFSRDFMEIISSLLAFDPINRPSIAEIMSHAWYNGETATHEEVLNYFNNKKIAVDHALNLEKIEKDRQRQINFEARNQLNDFAFRRGNAAQRDIKVDSSNDEEAQQEKKAELLHNIDKFNIENTKFP